MPRNRAGAQLAIQAPPCCWPPRPGVAMLGRLCARAPMPRPLLLAACLLLGACAPVAEPPSAPSPSAFVPGVEGRGPDEVCQTNSAECQEWTELARKCEENMRARDAGDMSPQRPYCTQAEALRERITGLEDSSAPGAYRF
jgi:hypothetical protein